MLADIVLPFRRRLHGALARRLGDADPLPDKIRDFGRCPLEQRADAAAHGVTHDHDLADAQRPHGEFDRGADAVRLIVGAVGRHQIGDVADDKQLARPRH